MNRKNAGVTIVEMVVVLAILSIAIGITLANVGNLTGYRARECAKKISSAISSNKVTTLGKAVNPDSIRWSITKEGNKVYFTVREYNSSGSVVSEEKELVGKGRMIVEYVDSNGTTGTHEIVSSGDDGDTKVTELCLYFNRSSGQICKSGETTRCNVSNIIISNPGRTKVYDIKVYPLTGKIKATW